jgi:hypothetical protein
MKMMKDVLAERLEDIRIMDNKIFVVSHAALPFRAWVTEHVAESSHVAFIT